MNGRRSVGLALTVVTTGMLLFQSPVTAQAPERLQGILVSTAAVGGGLGGCVPSSVEKFWRSLW